VALIGVLMVGPCNAHNSGLTIVVVDAEGFVPAGTDVALPAG
jgi:hypothetical protein